MTLTLIQRLAKSFIAASWLNQTLLDSHPETEEEAHSPLSGCGSSTPGFQLESQSQQRDEVKERGLLCQIHGPGLDGGISVMTVNRPVVDLHSF